MDVYMLMPSKQRIKDAVLNFLDENKLAALQVILAEILSACRNPDGSYNIARYYNSTTNNFIEAVNDSMQVSNRICSLQEGKSEEEAEQVFISEVENEVRALQNLSELYVDDYIYEIRCAEKSENVNTTSSNNMRLSPL